MDFASASLTDLARGLQINIQQIELTWAMVLQTAVAICGLTSLYLMTTRPPKQMTACAIGLAAQPIWLYTTWEAGQFGLFILAVAYTSRYIQVLAQWAKKAAQNSVDS